MPVIASSAHSSAIDPHTLTGEEDYSVSDEPTPETPIDQPDQSRDQPPAAPYPPVEDPYEGAVPPGYDWPTHGGYLGCLLGMMPACLVGGFLGSTFFAFLEKAQVVPGIVSGLLTAAVFFLAMIGFGRLGWVLGRRFYRAYPQPAPTWGEHDDAPSTSTASSPATQALRVGLDVASDIVNRAGDHLS